MAKKEPRELIRPEQRGTLAPFEEMERWFEDFFRRPFLAPLLPRLRFPEEVSPSVDVFEDKNDIVVKAEIPGMKKEDLDVNISEDAVTITGEKKSEEKVEKKDYYCCERSFGSFVRRIPLPVETQTDKAKASFKDGILEIKIPKTEEAKEKVKKITIE
jgi:HSP20 family protein